eukprot:Sro91_g047570.1 n/a (542) ;mRNA; r:23481-25106
MKELCSMWKIHAPTSYSDFIVWKERFRGFFASPLADFCLFGQDTSVQKLFLDEFPDEIFATVNDDSTEFDYNTIELFLDRCGKRNFTDNLHAKPPLLLPDAKQFLEAMLKLGPPGDYFIYSNLLASAVDGEYGKVLSPFLMKALVAERGVDSLVFEGEWTMNTLLSAATILSKLKSFRLDLEYSTISMDVYISTLNCLHCCPDDLLLADLKLPVLPDLLEDQDGKELMVAALQSCKVLKKLSLFLADGHRENMMAGQSLCSISQHIIHANSGITELSIANFSLDTATPLGDLISAAATTIKQLRLEVRKICEDVWVAPPITHNSKLELFKVKCRDAFHIEWTRGLLTQLQQLPELQTLSLRGTANFGGLHIGDEMAAILLNDRLQELTLCEGCYSRFLPAEMPIKWDPVIEALKQNSVLKKLDICSSKTISVENAKKVLSLVKEHNTTLEQVALPSCGTGNESLDRNIKYYATLNKHGRAKLRVPGATKHALVDCLCSVLERPNCYEECFSVNNLHYGLLRDAPSIWADPLSSPCKETESL